MLYHALVLHYDQYDKVKEIAVKILKKHDLTSIKVLSNKPEYLYRLNEEDKMILWFEAEICKEIGEDQMFMKDVA